MGVLGASVIMGLYYWLIRLCFGHTFSNTLPQPLGVALVAGLVAGRLSEAMVVEAGIQLVYLEATSAPGDSVPSDPALASAIAIPAVLGVGTNAKATIALAIPFGVLDVLMDQLRRAINATWVHMVGKCAEELNYGRICRTALVYPALMEFLIRFPLIFMTNFFGQPVVSKVLEVIPVWLMHGFEVMSGTLPALGFALTIMVIGKKNLTPYFLVGSIVVIYFDAEVMAVAILGVCIAFLARNKALSEGAV